MSNWWNAAVDIYSGDWQGAKEELGIDAKPLPPEPYATGSPYGAGQRHLGC